MMKMRERSRCSLLARVTIIVAIFICWNYFFLRRDQLIFPESHSYWDFNRSHVKSAVFQRHLRSAVDAIHQSNFTPPVNEKCKKRPPVAILIGVSKCGTRELLEFLHMHPHVELYRPKLNQLENPYFNNKSYYKKGKSWFVNEMPCSYSNQMTVMKNSEYFDTPHPTAERIHQFNSSIKLVLIVREPVARTVSRFMFEIQRGNIEKSSALEDVIFNNKTLDEKYNFISASEYDKRMEEWLKVFKREQFLIIDTNDFKYHPAKVLRQVEDFLGLGHFITPEHFVWNEEKGFYCIRTNVTDNGMACYSDKRGKKQLMDIDPETRRYLTDYFRPKVQRFFKITGCNFDWGY